MLITVGSQNEVKIQAVRKALSAYEHFWDAKVVGRNVPSGVSAQPTSLEETIRGAMNRAKNAFQQCDYSVGLESGLFAVPYTRTGYLDVCAGVIFDGQHPHVGLSSAFEYPPNVLRLVFEEGLDEERADSTSYSDGLSFSGKSAALSMSKASLFFLKKYRGERSPNIY